MDINSFIKSFAEQFDEIDAEVLKPETEFKKLDEWSSLVALMVISMIDEEYGITIGASEIRSSTTIKDLYMCVSEKC